jgi:hypothetical protein
VFDDLKTAGLLVGGFILGKTVSGLVDKATTSVSGMMGVDGTELKPYLRPVLTAGAGLVANQMVKNPLGKKLAIGVAAYGVMDAVQRISGKPLLAGLGEADTLVPLSYQALPEYRLPVMSPEIELPVASITSGVAEPSEITAGAEMNVESYTAGLGSDSIDLMEGFDDDDFVPTV